MWNGREELLSVEAELRSLGGDGGLADAKELWAQQLDALRASEDISTHEVALKYRRIKTDGGGNVAYRHDLTPHLEAVHDACDDPRYRVVAIKGPARSGKTIAWENHLLKVGMFGPSRLVGWYMHSEPDVRRYVDERVDWFLREHEGLWSKRDRARVPKWNLRRVDGELWEWLSANPSTTRGRSFSLAVADEIDAMQPKVRDAIITLLKNRQREYGSRAKILVSSHPDAGPLFGIDNVLLESDMRVRMAPCPRCERKIGPAREVPKERRMAWNVPMLMKEGESLSREELLDLIAENVRLICPFCKGEITNAERLAMRFEAAWMGKGQEIGRGEKITGDLIDTDTAGFVFHAVDAPFDSLAELARPFVAATIKFKDTGSEVDLKEVTVKTIGETYVREAPGSKVQVLKEVRGRLADTGYLMGTVPRGVDFLTAFVDVQGDRFEAGVIGWARTNESWLVDRFAAKQLEGFQDIRPHARLSDWDVLQFILAMTYPINDGSGLHLPIAKLAVDTGGVPGVTEKARAWYAKVTGRDVGIPGWKLALLKGDAHHEGEFLGPLRKITHDKAQREYAMPVYERTVNVFEVKKVIAYRRDEVLQPGPLKMHVPGDITDKQLRELIAEVLVNDEWLPTPGLGGRNELWDIWVGAEVCRQLLNPEDVQINWDSPPIWARPFNPSTDGPSGGMPTPSEDILARLKQFNRRRR